MFIQCAISLIAQILGLMIYIFQVIQNNFKVKINQKNSYFLSFIQYRFLSNGQPSKK